MLNVTPTAFQQLFAIKRKNRIPPAQALRLKINREEIMLTAGAKQPDDHIIVDDADALLVADRQTAEALKESTLDCRENSLVVTTAPAAKRD